MRGVHMGNFGEVKNSTLGPGVKMGHFSYVGDATVGAGANIGAGTITCNFDGRTEEPHRDRRGRVHRQRHDAGGAGDHWRRRGDRGRERWSRATSADHSLAVGAPARTIRKLVPHD